jgi:hypothetical protein
MSDGPETPVTPITSVPPLTKQQRRDARRRAARERAAQEEAEEEALANRPLTVCAWCGFGADFDEDATDEEKAKCPACAISYATAAHRIVPDVGDIISSDRLTDDGIDLAERQAQMARDAVHRRIATALDTIAGILSEQWEQAQEAAEHQGGFR